MKPYQKLLIGAAGLATGIGLSIYGSQQYKDKPDIEEPARITAAAPSLEMKVGTADEVLRKFPTEIPGAKAVQEYPVPGSKQCLVHIRQMHHLTDLLRERLLKENPTYVAEGERRVSLVQGEIYSILSYLVNKLSINEVYVEGFTGKEAADFNELCDTMRAEGIVVASGEIFQDALIRHIDGFKPIIDRYAQVGDKSKLYEIGAKLNKLERATTISSSLDRQITTEAFARLALEGRLTIRGPENFGMPKGRRFTKDSLYSPEAEKEVQQEYVEAFEKMEEREDSILASLFRGRLPISLLPFGGDHDFRNNVDKWNKNHPDDKFSLIVVTPKNLED